jgi:integrase
MASIFKRKRSDGKLASRWTIRVAVNGRDQWISGYADKRATEEKAARLQARLDRGEVDLLDQYAEHKARPLGEHVADYVADLKAQGRDGKYVYIMQKRLEKIARDCNWNSTADIKSISFIHWRQNNSKLAPKTVNEYLQSLNSFFLWMVRHGRMAENPTQHVAAVEQRGKEKRIRRALNDVEISRLLAKAGPRKTLYLLALTTGLRRGELEALKWDDVRLAAVRPYLLVRASVSKNHKTATMFLRDDTVKALRSMSTGDATGLVFPTMPTPELFRDDLEAAGIDPKDAQGRIVDFHALRHSFITGLSRAGVTPRVAMELARHSEMGLTMRVYTDGGLLGAADAIDALPRWDNPANEAQAAVKTGTHDSPEPVSKSATESATSVCALALAGSRDDAQTDGVQTTINKGKRGNDAQVCTNVHNISENSAGRTRTYNKSVNSRLLYH